MRQTSDVGPPDYAAALDLTGDAAPGHLTGLVEAVARPLGAKDVRLYLADFGAVTLRPLPSAGAMDHGDGDGDGELDVAGSMAGRAFRTGAPVTAERDSGARVWVPLVEHGERTGVVAMTVGSLDDAVIADTVRLGRFAGLLVASVARTTDLVHIRRRRQDMTLAAGMQWDLLPPLAVRSTQALACGRLEPAYSIAGDAFDYALDDRHLHAGLFDGMGHGVHSTLMTALAVGAYRHARRAGLPLDEVRAAVDGAVGEQYGGEAFVTAAFARLGLGDGVLEWTVAGHPTPLLLRDQRVLAQLDCAPSLPLGLGGTCREVAAEQLEPGDTVLFFTDGVVEGRGASGEELGVARLAEWWEHHAASQLEGDEVLRRLVEEVLAHNGGALRDDASLLSLSWAGPDGGDARGG